MTTSVIRAADPAEGGGRPTLSLMPDFGAAEALDLVVAMRSTTVDGHLVLHVSAVPAFDVASLTAVLRGVRSLHEDGGLVTVRGSLD